MPYEILTAQVLFAFVSTITPGPNNLMLMASGANYGFGRTVPHMLGVLIGFMLMCLLVGVGLTRVFDAFPVIYRVLKLVSVLYLLYLAWRIATAAGPGDEGAASGSPLTFFQAALFQWVNPKAWAVVAAVFGIVTGPSITVWTLAGQQLRRLLTSTLRLRLFNGLMALLLVASLYPVLSPLFQSGWVVAIGAE
jgi:threonine/homoserine/homoserine lactone efflux protein